ncbi:Uncharacterised protein [Mycobacterium tuberculosis]|nr:Uncharacterised protein [Mycobacterium tuberculosis]
MRISQFSNSGRFTIFPAPFGEVVRHGEDPFFIEFGMPNKQGAFVQINIRDR